MSRPVENNMKAEPPREAATRRIEERVETALPVMLATGDSGITRDISASGVFFQTGAPVKQGDPIEFSIEFQDGRGQRNWVMHCRGIVVRVEGGPSGQGVAAAISESKLGVRS
jgi:hypothetical protein